MKSRTLLLFLALSCNLFYAQKITFDKTKKLYGIKDKSNKWLTLPIYNHIQEVNGKGLDDNKVLFYHAKTKNKHVLLNKNGITKLSAEYDSIGLTANPNVLIYKKGANYYRGASMNSIPTEKNKFKATPVNIDGDQKHYLIKIKGEGELFDAEKNEILPEKISNALHIGYETIVLKNKKWYFLNNPNEIYDTIYCFWLQESPNYIVKKSNLYGVMDHPKNVIIPIEYENIIANKHSSLFMLKKNGKFNVSKLSFHYNEEKNENTVSLNKVIPNLFDTILGIDNYGYYWDKDRHAESKKVIGIQNGNMVHVRLEDGLEIVPLKYKYIRPVCEGCIDKDENRLYFVTNDFDNRKDTLNTLSFELKKLNYTYGISSSKGELIVPIEGKPLPVYTDFEPRSHFGDSIQSNFDAKDSSFLGIVWLKNTMIKYQENDIKYNYMEAFDNNGNVYLDSAKSIRYSIFPENGTASIILKNGVSITPSVDVNNISFNFKSFIYQDGQPETHLQSLTNYTVTSKEREAIYSDINPGIYVSPHSPVFYKEKNLIGAYTWDGKKIIPPSLDSITGINSYGFKAYKKGFCTNFKYHAKDYLFESDLCYPDLKNAPFSLLCKNCDFEYSKIKHTKRNILYNNEGYEFEKIDTLISLIPDIKSGKFNIMNNKFEKILPEWADEIVFPYGNEEYYYNIFNRNKTINDITYESSLETVIVDIKNHGFAARYGQKWVISSVSEHKTIKDVFDSVSFKDDKWICKKGNNITEYNSKDFSNE